MIYIDELAKISSIFQLFSQEIYRKIVALEPKSSMW